MHQRLKQRKKRRVLHCCTRNPVKKSHSQDVKIIMANLHAKVSIERPEEEKSENTIQHRT